MISMSRRPIALAALVAISLIGTAARADLILTVQEDAGPVQTFTVLGAPTTDPTFSQTTVTTPDYTIKVLGGEANQNSEAQLLSSTTSITNSTGSAGHTLNITITGTGYTGPTTPPNITALSHIGGTVATVSAGSTNSLSFTSNVIPAVFGPPGPFTPQTPSITSVGSYSNDQTRTITGLSAPFNMVETLAVVLNALNAKINYSSSTTLTPNTAVPEPSTLAVAGIGSLGLIGCGLRRRRKAVSA